MKEKWRVGRKEGRKDEREGGREEKQNYTYLMGCYAVNIGMPENI